MNDAPHSDDKRAAAASDSCASEAAPSLPASPAPVDVISEAPTSGVEDEHTKAVTAMFSRMTPWYDFQNHAFSLGVDFWWRRNLVRAVAPGPTGVVLDLAAGTLDVTLALIRRYPGLRVIAADICAPMLLSLIHISSTAVGDATKVLKPGDVIWVSLNTQPPAKGQPSFNLADAAPDIVLPLRLQEYPDVQGAMACPHSCGRTDAHSEFVKT